MEKKGKKNSNPVPGGLRGLVFAVGAKGKGGSTRFSAENQKDDR